MTFDCFQVLLKMMRWGGLGGGIFGDYSLVCHLAQANDTRVLCVHAPQSPSRPFGRLMPTVGQWPCPCVCVPALVCHPCGVCPCLFGDRHGATGHGVRGVIPECLSVVPTALPGRHVPVIPSVDINHGWENTHTHTLSREIRLICS